MLVLSASIQLSGCFYTPPPQDIDWVFVEASYGEVLDQIEDLALAASEAEWNKRHAAITSLFADDPLFVRAYLSSPSFERFVNQRQLRLGQTTGSKGCNSRTGKYWYENRMMVCKSNHSDSTLQYRRTTSTPTKNTYLDIEFDLSLLSHQAKEFKSRNDSRSKHPVGNDIDFNGTWQLADYKYNTAHEIRNESAVLQVKATEIPGRYTFSARISALAELRPNGERYAELDCSIDLPNCSFEYTAGGVLDVVGLKVRIMFDDTLRRHQVFSIYDGRVYRWDDVNSHAVALSKLEEH